MKKGRTTMKRKSAVQGSNNKERKRKKLDEDEEIESLSEESEAISDKDDEQDYETPHEKRVRLTSKWAAESLRTVKANEEETEGLRQRLVEEALEAQGKLIKFVADQYTEPDVRQVLTLRGHKRAVTCVTVSNSGEFIFTGGKDAAVIKWNTKDGHRVQVIPGGRRGSQHPFHMGRVLAIAMSSDDKFLATGDVEKKIFIWNPITMEKLHVLTRHRSAVLSLSFRRQSHQLFSGSQDGAIFVWNLELMDIIEDLIGHRSEVTGLASLNRDQCVSCSGLGGPAVFLWKVPEEVSSSYKIGNMETSLECITMLNDSKFVAGSSSNKLYLWVTGKASPSAIASPAHTPIGPAAGDVWVTSVAALPNTDLLASGSSAGEVRLWRVHLPAEDIQQHLPKKLKKTKQLHEQIDKAQFVLLFSIQMDGFVNDLVFTSDGRKLVAAVGQEHRLGRWHPLWKQARNSVKIIPLELK